MKEDLKMRIASLFYWRNKAADINLSFSKEAYYEVVDIVKELTEQLTFSQEINQRRIARRAEVDVIVGDLKDKNKELTEREAKLVEALRALIEDTLAARDEDNINCLYGAKYNSDCASLTNAKTLIGLK